MECAQVREQIVAYQDKMLLQEEARLLEQHLQGCRDCNEYFSDMRKMLAHVRKLEKVEPPPGMARKIITKIRAEVEPAPKKGLFRKLFHPFPRKLPIQAAAALLIAVSVFYVYNTMQPDLKNARMPAGEYAPQVSIQKQEKSVEGMREIFRAPRMSPDSPAEVRDTGRERLQEDAVQEKEHEQQGAFDESPVNAQGQARAVPSARTAAKHTPEAQAQFRLAEKKSAAGEKEVRFALVTRVPDIEAGSRHVQEAILHLDGEILATVSSRDRTIFTAELDTGKLQELIEMIEIKGEVHSKKIMYDKGEDRLVIEIEIVQHSR